MTSIELKYSNSGGKDYSPQPPMEGKVLWHGIGIVDIRHIQSRPDIIRVRLYDDMSSSKPQKEKYVRRGRTVTLFGKNSARLKVVHPR